MKKLILALAIFLITVSAAQPQSLKSISDNRFILKDSINTGYLDSSLKKNSNIKKETRKGDYVTFSTGIFVSTRYRSSDNNVPYTSLDLNISLGSVFYLDLDAYGIFFSRESSFAVHGTLGVGFDVIPDKLFTYAGVGPILLLPVGLTEIAILRINYKFSKDLSAGLDNKFMNFGNPGNLAYRYIVGLNFSYRFNY